MVMVMLSYAISYIYKKIIDEKDLIFSKYPLKISWRITLVYFLL